MAIAFRKTLVLAALALTSTFLSAGQAGAADPAPYPGVYCLANAWQTPNISTKGCDSEDLGQHWTVSGQQISLTNARGYCLANAWGTPDVSVKPCDPGDQGQYWTVSGQQISLAYAPAYCFANIWQTPEVSTQPCSSTDPGQRWAIFSEQISLAFL